MTAIVQGAGWAIKIVRFMYLLMTHTTNYLTRSLKYRAHLNTTKIQIQSSRSSILPYSILPVYLSTDRSTKQPTVASYFVVQSTCSL